MSKILVLGGYGHFGKKIAEALIIEGIPVILVGRNHEKMISFQTELANKYPSSEVECFVFDIFKSLDKHLKQLQPKIVINTCGPFQDQDYQIAMACINNHSHYLDLADARDFVRDISMLNDKAVQHNVAVISGASSVPALTSAVIEEYKPFFSKLNGLEFGINSAQQTPGGLATTEAILSYTGKEIPKFSGARGKIFGWQDLHRVKLPECGKRWMSNCSIPDLDLFPPKYGFKSIQFSGGVESGFLHLGLWVISWLIRAGLPVSLKNHANVFYRISKFFDRFGSDAGGMYIFINGMDFQNRHKTVKWYIIAKKNHGQFIPTIPAIVLAKKIYNNQYSTPGAQPCVGLVTLKECLEEMTDLDITTYVEN
ncbi:saccharopine dehydrogenase NADP-binding domain-containing protein [Legionella pneumophila]|nr:saccharopine dehydrogenase NADP-binding domain-containing protein [Legionella pneumophila]